MILKYRAVFLRRNNRTHHLFAVDPGNGSTEYVEIPLATEQVEVGLNSRTKHHQRQDQTFEFGQRVDLTIETVDE